MEWRAVAGGVPGKPWTKVTLLSEGGLTPAQFLSPFTDRLPKLTLPAGVGVNIHFTTGHEQDLNMITNAGFKFVRMDFSWKTTEREKGVYDWSDYDRFTAELEQRGLRPYYILGYGNPLYEENVTSTNPVTHKVDTTTAAPQHPESIVSLETRQFQGYDQPASYPEYVDWRKMNHTLAVLGGFSPWGTANLESGTGPVSLPVVEGSDNFFDVFGVRPLIGRTYAAGD